MAKSKSTFSKDVIDEFNLFKIGGLSMKFKICFIQALSLMLAFLLSSSLSAQYASLNNTKLNSTTENAEFIPKFLLNPISVNLENVSLAKALSEISKKGNLRLTYSKSLIPTQLKVSVQAKNTPVIEILGKILYESGTNFTVAKNGQILLFPSNELGKVLYASGTSFTVSEGGQVLFFPSREIESGLYMPTTGTISGKVIDSRSGEGLPGANVLLKGTTIGAASAADGSFTIANVPPGSYSVVVSFIGYHTQETDVRVAVNEVVNLSFSLAEDVFRTEEIVVTGIASKTSRAVAEVAVSRVRASDYTVANTYNSTQSLLNGKIAGVSVKTTSGNVAAGFRFDVRSGGGLNGDGQPLIYLDGVRIDNSQFEASGFDVGGQGISLLADLNPEEIENIEILKGPAAAASYGTSGSNGVVLITTKKGRLFTQGAKNVNFNYKFVTGWNNVGSPYSPDEYIIANRANKSLFKTSNTFQNSVSAAGGSNILRYFLSFDSRDEEGTLAVSKSRMVRKNIRTNIDVVPNDQLKFSVNASYINSTINRPDGDNSTLGAINNVLLAFQGINAFALTDSAAMQTIVEEAKTNRFIGSLQVEWTPIQGLQSRLVVGIDDHDLRDDRFLPRNPGFFNSIQQSGFKQVVTRRSRNLTYNFDVRYTFNPFSDFSLSAVAGTQLFDRRIRRARIAKSDFPNALISNVASGSELQNADETFSHRREAGIFGETSLSFKDQYFGSLRLRRDYASVVGQKTPSILYPGASFAVRMDKYDWFPSVFNLMKLRAAYGETGVLPNLLDGIELLWTTAPWGGGPTGAVLGTIGNPEIKPERVKEIEMGVDLEFSNAYALEFTYYRQTSTNSIIGFLDAPSTGQTATRIPRNVGEAEGWGLESLLQASLIRKRNVGLDLTLINNYRDNKVTDLGGAPPIFFAGFTSLNVTKEGLPKFEFYERRVLGAGFDDSGVYTGPLATDEFEALGNPIPKYTGSFAVNLRVGKNIRLYALSDWATGQKMYNVTDQFGHSLAVNPRYNRLANLLGIAGVRNVVGGVGGNVPVDDAISPLTVGSAEYNAAAEEFARMDFRFKDNLIEDADFFRILELSVSYSLKDVLPKIFGRNATLQDLVIAFSATNLFTRTKFSDGTVDSEWDGARSSGRGQYFSTLPTPRSYNLSFRFAL